MSNCTRCVRPCRKAISVQYITSKALCVWWPVPRQKAWSRLRVLKRVSFYPSPQSRQTLCTWPSKLCSQSFKISWWALNRFLDTVNLMSGCSCSSAGFIADIVDGRRMGLCCLVELTLMSHLILLLLWSCLSQQVTKLCWPFQSVCKMCMNDKSYILSQ